MSTYFRNEIKYICTQNQLYLLRQRILGAGCRPDSHTSGDGVYNIRSLYFDDYDNSCYWDNINGSNPREKFRIRIYNGQRSTIKLECKQKVNDKIHKESCLITEEECMGFIHGKVLPRKDSDSLYDKFGMMISAKGFKPKIIVDYERTAFVYSLGNVRITFDRNISSSTQFDCFLEPNISKRPVMALNKHIIEVKYDELLPNYIYNALELEALCRTAYSKYCICRKYYL